MEQRCEAAHRGNVVAGRAGLCTCRVQRCSPDAVDQEWQKKQHLTDLDSAIADKGLHSVVSEVDPKAIPPRCVKRKDLNSSRFQRMDVVSSQTLATKFVVQDVCC